MFNNALPLAAFSLKVLLVYQCHCVESYQTLAMEPPQPVVTPRPTERQTEPPLAPCGGNVKEIKHILLSFKAGVSIDEFDITLLKAYITFMPDYLKKDIKTALEQSMGTVCLTPPSTLTASATTSQPANGMGSSEGDIKLPASPKRAPLLPLTNEQIKLIECNRDQAIKRRKRAQ